MHFQSTEWKSARAAALKCEAYIQLSTQAFLESIHDVALKISAWRTKNNTCWEPLKQCSCSQLLTAHQTPQGFGVLGCLGMLQTTVKCSCIKSKGVNMWREIRWLKRNYPDMLLVCPALVVLVDSLFRWMSLDLFKHNHLWYPFPLHPSIIRFSSTYPIQGHGESGAYPSWHRARGLHIWTF